MNSKNNSTFITILAILTLLLALAGSSFIIYNTFVNNKEKETILEVPGGTITIEYDNNKNIKKKGISFGEKIAEKTFNVTGTVGVSSKINYEVALVITNNTFADSILQYRIETTNMDNNGFISESTSEPIGINMGNSTIKLAEGMFEGPINGSATHAYKLIIESKLEEGNTLNDEEIDAYIKVIQK